MAGQSISLLWPNRVHQFTGLFRDGLCYCRVGMAKSAYRDTTQDVHVLPVFSVPQPDAFTAFKLDWQPLVGRHKMISHFLLHPK
jgi:hypothetical protein